MGMNERLGLGKKNEERKKDNQSLGLFYEAHGQGFQCSTKATRHRGQNEAMQGATSPGQAFQGRVRTRSRRMM
eukprot:scaffold15581_cov85-Skeletonema_dohrnii-CCMP3373.AAC.2